MTEPVYEKLTEKIMLTGSKLIPQIFKMLADKDEANLLLAMPGTPEQLAETVDRTAVEIEKMCLPGYRPQMRQTAGSLPAGEQRRALHP